MGPFLTDTASSPDSAGLDFAHCGQSEVSVEVFRTWMALAGSGIRSAFNTSSSIEGAAGTLRNSFPRNIVFITCQRHRSITMRSPVYHSSGVSRARSGRPFSGPALHTAPTSVDTGPRFPAPTDRLGPRRRYARDPVSRSNGTSVPRRESF